MKILFNNRIRKHNSNETEGDGPYRVREFEETVSDEELKNLYDQSESFMKTVHPDHYIKEIEQACMKRGEMAEIQLTPETYEAIKVSVALSIKAVLENAFAVIRPAGHHAYANHGEGFCLINTESIATQYLLDQGKRVAIIDFDGHHGNGTQDIFKDDDRVFFSSIQQIGQYPHSGAVTEQGEGPSIGNVVNVPLWIGSGDDLFLKTLKVIIKKLKEFKPDYIIVVAGFDGYHKDNLLNLKYSKQGFYEAGKLIADIKIPTCALLAGGYHNEIKGCTDAFIAGFNNETIDTGEELTTSSDECIGHAESMFKYLSFIDDYENRNSNSALFDLF